MNRQRISIKHITVGVLMFFSFLITYYLFHAIYFPVVTSAQNDPLSGENYAPLAVEDNPYAPYFVGFDTLSDRGVTNDELRYINDVLTNFTMYDKNIYKAKVSYVKDSFSRDYTESLSTTYRFKFGINDQNINTMSVTSDTINQKIALKITDNDDKVVFDKNFIITLSNFTD